MSNEYHRRAHRTAKLEPIDLSGVSDDDIKTFTHSPERSIDLLELGRVTQIK
jgi:hypothetical protein